MTLALILIGVYALLWAPFLGHILQHAFGHVTAHILDHHETEFAVALSILVSLLVVLVPVLAVLDFWWASLDDFLLLAILFRLFSGGH